MDKLSEIGGLMKTIAAILLLVPCCAFDPGALGQDKGGHLRCGSCLRASRCSFHDRR
jgi:hypothetical protein